MIRRITLINFMSHVETVIDLAEGLTVLVGPNNSGKSAVVEAIQAVCQNNPTKYMVRHGENECRVVIETDEGHTIQWKRKGSVVSYTLDGQDVHRLGGGVPDNLHQLLRLPLIESPDGRDKFDIHIGHQKEPVFLLDQSGGKAAMFFASASDARLLLEMQRLHKKRTTERRRDETHFSTRVTFLHSQVKTLEPLAQVDRRLAEAEEKRERVQELNEAMISIQSSIDELQQNSHQVGFAKARKSALQSLTTPPTQTDVKPLDTLVKEMERLGEDKKLQTDRTTALAALAVPPVLRDVSPLDSLIGSLDTFTANESRQSELTKVLGKLDSPPVIGDTHSLAELLLKMRECTGNLGVFAAEATLLEPLPSLPVMHDTSPLKTMCNSLSKASEGVKAAQWKVNKLENLPAMPAPLDPVPLSDLTRKLHHVIGEVDEQRRQQDEIDKELTAVKDRMRAWARVNPTCPICGTRIDENRLIAGGPHRHG